MYMESNKFEKYGKYVKFIIAILLVLGFMNQKHIVEKYCIGPMISDRIVQNIISLKEGEDVYFGRYYQDTKKEKESIAWRVLAVKDDKVLLISECVLDCQKYNENNEDTSWEECTLRKWLNNDFLNSAFSDTEQNMIQLSTITADENPDYSTNQGNNTKDKIFLLSAMEAKLYFKNDEDRKCNLTNLAINHGAIKYFIDGRLWWWWLRSMGSNGNYVAIVNPSGSVDYNGSSVDIDYVSVRPALWINLKNRYEMRMK